jgi:CRP-like cAMP-binding protein
MIKEWKVAPGTLIIRENDPGVTAFYIESGRVEVTKDVNGKRAHLAFLQKGATFGEMSMVDELPRSASVTAVEETLVREFHREDLYAAMMGNPEIFSHFLRNIFERLREANRAVAAMTPDVQTHARLAKLRDPSEKNQVFTIEGITPRAAGAIAENPAVIRTFPFKIGRKSDDPFLYNHFEIEDQDPAQIARHHVSIVYENGRVGVIDRGSELGATVDGHRIGGKHGPGPVFFEGKEGVLVLGSEDSPYQYRVKVSWGP